MTLATYQVFETYEELQARSYRKVAEQEYAWVKCLKLMDPGFPTRVDSGIWRDRKGEVLLAYFSEHPDPNDPNGDNNGDNNGNGDNNDHGKNDNDHGNGNIGNNDHGSNSDSQDVPMGEVPGTTSDPQQDTAQEKPSEDKGKEKADSEKKEDLRKKIKDRIFVSAALVYPHSLRLSSF